MEPYIILSSMIIVVVLFEAKSRVSVVSKLKPHVEFLVLMLTSLYSFFADRSTKGKPDTWSVVSSVAFALTSLSVFIAANQAWVRFVLGSYSESQSENGDSSAEESVVIRIDDDDANRMTAGFRYPLLWQPLSNSCGIYKNERGGSRSNSSSRCGSSSGRSSGNCSVSSSGSSSGRSGSGGSRSCSGRVAGRFMRLRISRLVRF
ncbi:hypothetical protein K1719_043172 [Acacia pycnantha]|nr:hypothetical protein K1719_043172 [Acacia pycnantha]